MNRLIFACLVTAVLADGAFAQRSSLRPTEPIYDFGGIGIDFDLFHDFKLVNTGKEPIRLDSVVASCDCTRLLIRDSLAQPQETLTVRLHFNTKDYYGKVSKAMHVFTSEGGGRTFDVFYLATVGQYFHGMKPDPLSVFFLPAQSARPLTITNMAIERATLTAIKQYDSSFTVTTRQQQVGRGERFQFELTADPKITSGTIQSNVRFSFLLSGIPDTLHISVPVKIARF